MSQNILITGIGKGLGREIFLQTVNSGAYVIGVTRSKKDIKDLNKINGRFKFFFGMFAKNTIKAIFDYLKKNKIKLTGLVNNAGISKKKV